MLLLLADLQPELDQQDAAFDDELLERGQSSRNARTAPCVQKPMTYSTPARLYQLRSKITTSPRGREVLDVALHVELRLLAVGRAGSATTRKTRGLTRSVIALIVPPLPAASRPSKTMITRKPACLDPILQLAKLRLELAQLLLVILALELFRCFFA